MGTVGEWVAGKTGNGGGHREGWLGMGGGVAHGVWLRWMDIALF